MILSHNQLQALIDDGVIRNVEREQVNASSIDVRLGEVIMYEGNRNMSSIDLAKGESLPMLNARFRQGDTFTLHPGQFILASTMETFYLPRHISAEFTLKSTRARQGVNHSLAGWCDAGWTGSSLTLELKNNSQFTSLVFTVGMRIGQLIFHAHEAVEENQSYAAVGRYNHDKEVSGAKK